MRKRLTLDDRLVIEEMVHESLHATEKLRKEMLEKLIVPRDVHLVRRIATRLGVKPATIYLELRRVGSDTYAYTAIKGQEAVGMTKAERERLQELKRERGKESICTLQN